MIDRLSHRLRAFLVGQRNRLPVLIKRGEHLEDPSADHRGQHGDPLIAFAFDCRPEDQRPNVRDRSSDD